MKKHAIAIGKDAGRLAVNARALLAATADVAGDRIEEIRNRMAEELKTDEEIYCRVRDRVHDRVVSVTRTVDQAMHTSPYRAAAIGIGCGALIGFLAARRVACHRG